MERARQVATRAHAVLFLGGCQHSAITQDAIHAKRARCDDRERCQKRLSYLHGVAEVTVVKAEE